MISGRLSPNKESITETIPAIPITGSAMLDPRAEAFSRNVSTTVADKVHKPSGAEPGTFSAAVQNMTLVAETPESAVVVKKIRTQSPGRLFLWIAL